MNAPTFWYLNALHWPDIEARMVQSAASQARPADQPMSKRPEMDAWGASIDQMRMVDGVAVVPVRGALLKGAHPVLKKYLMADYDDIAEDMTAARAQKAKAVVLNISSPGGMAVGAGELGAFVEQFAKQTPVFSFTDSMQCSAAEYLSGACTARFATADAIVGSIGTILTSVSYEGMLKEMGIKATVFASGKFKGAGSPYKDLTEEQADFMQSFVLTLAGEFKGHMSKHRPALKGEAMEGQIFTGKQGAQNGLIDANVSGLAEVISIVR